MHFAHCLQTLGVPQLRSCAGATKEIHNPILMLFYLQERNILQSQACGVVLWHNPQQAVIGYIIILYY